MDNREFDTINQISKIHSLGENNWHNCVEENFVHEIFWEEFFRKIFWQATKLPSYITLPIGYLCQKLKYCPSKQ